MSDGTGSAYCTDQATEQLRVVTFDERFLGPSWEWLNDPEIKWLTQSPSFTKEQQLEWFRNLPDRTDYLVWGVELTTVPIAVFGIKNIEISVGEYWGYIGKKNLWGKGIGRWILTEAIRNAQAAGLRKLYLKVLSDNSQAVNLYQKTGFVQIGMRDRLMIMERAV